MSDVNKDQDQPAVDPNAKYDQLPISDEEFNEIMRHMHDDENAEVEEVCKITFAKDDEGLEGAIKGTPDLITIGEPLPFVEFVSPEEDEVPQKKKKNRFSLRNKFREFFDPKIWPTELESLSHVDRKPKKINIGFLTNIKKKDLIGYINEWIVDNNCNRSSCAYQAVSWNGGYAYEVQEGGTGKGCLQSILKHLPDNEELTVPSDDRYLRVSRRHDGFSVYMLNEFEKYEASTCVDFVDSLSPVYKRNHGLMLGGLAACVFASLFFLSSWFLVYTVYNKSKVPVFAKVSVETPSQQISKIVDIAKRDDAFLKALTYKDGKWKINLETVAAPEPVQPDVPTLPSAPGTPLLPAGSVPQAKVDKELIHLHRDLVKTLAEQQP